MDRPILPEYECLNMIGSGAYGDVWIARTQTDSLCAVKVVHRRRFDNPRPFDREFHGIQKYGHVSHRHPALIDILHVGRANEFFYYVMPLADSISPSWKQHLDRYRARTLRSILTKGPIRPIEEAVDITLDLLDAVGELHRAGLVHRDIKPANVLFIRKEPVLADVGLIASSGNGGSLVGTPGYISPEGPGQPRT